MFKQEFKITPNSAVVIKSRFSIKSSLKMEQCFTSFMAVRHRKEAEHDWFSLRSTDWCLACGTEPSKRIIRDRTFCFLQNVVS